ncbi:MAG: VWA domain-containing protein [Acidobacteriota bacterium]|nr:VWA domain-containing protein [Acidobacteriota bacterium]
MNRMISHKSGLPTSRSAFLMLASALVLFALVNPVTSQSTTAGGVDWILVLDTSASMRGAGGARDIFATVRNSVGEFIRQARDGDSITFFTFDRDTRMHPTVRIADETDKRDLLRVLDEIKPEGDRTHTGKALRDALKRAAEVGSRVDAATRTVTIVLFTDGIEDVRDISNPVSIPSNIDMLPEKRPFIFFISLGESEHEKQLDEFVNHAAIEGRGEVVRDPGAQRLAELNARVRMRITLPIELEIGLEPTDIDFGQLQPGETTARHNLYVRGNLAAKASLSLGDPAAGEVVLIEPTEAIELRAGETVVVPVRLSVAPGAPDGTRSLRLTLTAHAPGPDAAAHKVTIDGRLEVAHISVWSRALKWLAILLILLVLATIGFSLLKGEFPWTMWTNWRERRHLEGEIEVIHPVPPQPEGAFIGLRNLRQDRAALDTLVPDGATADANAEMTTRFKNGRKLISLTRTAGAVRVNRAEVVTTDLYDGDVIELGNARLRFNWIGHARPTDSDENF